jgi:hypothetical protein
MAQEATATIGNQACTTNNDESFSKNLQQNPMQTVLHPHNNLLLPTRYLLLPAAVKSPITSSSQTRQQETSTADRHKKAGNQYC